MLMLVHSRPCFACCCHVQVLVVSVTGTPNRSDGVSFTDDFVEAALLAKRAGEQGELSCIRAMICGGSNHCLVVWQCSDLHRNRHLHVRALPALCFRC